MKKANISNTQSQTQQIEEPVNKPIGSISTAEQETVIQFGRTDEYATLCTSDRTMMTKLDKLCEKSPEYYSLTDENSAFKTYRIHDKGLISLRQKKREVSDEAKAAASERFKQMWADKKDEQA